MRGVYIHIPFCKTICTYCDFCKVFYQKSWVSAYLRMLRKEIENIYENDTIKSIYIGGGSPSALTIKELTYLFTLTKKFKTIKDIFIFPNFI